MSTSPLSRIGLPTTDETASGLSGRKAVLGIAGLLSVLLALGAQLLLGGGSDELDDLGTPPVAAAAEPVTTASPSATPAPLRSPDEATARDGRYPFAALYVEPPAGADAPATGAPEADAAAPETGTPAVPAAPAAPTAGPDVGNGGVAAPSSGTGALTIALLRTEGTEPSRTAVFMVDGAEVPVTVGGSFGPSDSLLLLSLQQGPAAGGWTAVVQSGQGEPFDVATAAVVPVR